MNLPCMSCFFHKSIKTTLFTLNDVQITLMLFVHFSAYNSKVAGKISELQTNLFATVGGEDMSSDIYLLFSPLPVTCLVFVLYANVQM